jgi:hypothetical protein
MVESQLIEVKTVQDRTSKNKRATKTMKVMPGSIGDSVWLSQSDKTKLRSFVGMSWAGVLQKLQVRWKGMKPQEQHGSFRTFVRNAMDLKGRVCNVHKSVLSSSGSRKSALMRAGLITNDKKSGLDYKKVGPLISKPFSQLIQALDQESDEYAEHKQILKMEFSTPLKFVPESVIKAAKTEPTHCPILGLYHNVAIVGDSREYFESLSQQITAVERIKAEMEDAALSEIDTIPPSPTPTKGAKGAKGGGKVSGKQAPREIGDL